jgi:hypothetical protein
MNTQTLPTMDHVAPVRLDIAEAIRRIVAEHGSNIPLDPQKVAERLLREVIGRE